MFEKTIVPFPTMELAQRSIELFREQNQLTPAELMEIVVAGSVQVQASTGRAFHPVAIQWGPASAGQMAA